MNFIIVLLLLILPLPAHAYIDPGAGSAVIQVIIASIVGGLFGLKVLWQKFKAKVSKK